MQHRDIIKDEIEQMGKVLAQIIAKYLGLKSNGNVASGIEIANKELQSELHINVEQLSLLNEEDLNSFLRERKMSESQIVQLADYFLEVAKHAEKTEPSRARRFYSGALNLLRVAGLISEVFSMERSNKESIIQKAIDALD